MDVGSLGIFLAYGVENLIYQWEELGVFQFLLPFLLIFAVVFGILSTMKIFGGNKGIHLIISLVIGLLAVRTPIFADVLREVSPRLGVGLVIVLAALILVGMFVPKGARGGILWMLFGIGAIVFLIILIQLYGLFQIGGPFGSWQSDQVIPIVVLIGLFIAIVVGVILSGDSKSSKISDKLKNTVGSLFGEDW